MKDFQPTRFWEKRYIINAYPFKRQGAKRISSTKPCGLLANFGLDKVIPDRAGAIALVPALLESPAHPRVAGAVL